MAGTTEYTWDAVNDEFVDGDGNTLIPNTAPVAVDDTIPGIVQWGDTVTYNVVNNDYDPDGDSLYFELVPPKGNTNEEVPRNVRNSRYFRLFVFGYGGNIDLRVVLDARVAGGWIATWYAKRPADPDYLQTRAAETVIDTEITSVGFGINTYTTGYVTSFNLTLAYKPAGSVILVQ